MLKSRERKLSFLFSDSWTDRFIYLCKLLQVNPTDEDLWRRIFGDYLDNSICTVVIVKDSRRRARREEFLAYVSKG
jgi:hypothetical protein